MSIFRFFRFGSVFALTFLVIGALGCEGIDRHHDARVGDISPPREDVDFQKASTTETANFPDLIEEMIQKRDAYIAHMIQIERAYLDVGDINRANWARRQRELTEKIEVYPYLTEQTQQQSVQVQVIPRDSIPEADKVYDEAYAMYDKFVGVPFVGFAYLNKKEPREAADVFKRVINEYPTSDKVDDAAYFIGNIYKEFLRNDDPDNELALRYLKWAWSLDPNTPHPARFDAAVIYDFRLHDRDKAIELYHEVLGLEEAGNNSNQRFSATRVAQLTDDDESHLKPQEPRVANQKPQPQRTDKAGANEPVPDTSREPGPVSSRIPESEGDGE